MGIANTTAAAALTCAFTGADPADATGRGTGIDDATLARKIDVVRRALALHRPDPADPLGVLAAFGGLEHAALAGFVLGGAAARVPVLLDGVNAGAAALVAAAFAPHAVGACLAGHRSVEPAHRLALAHLGLDPLIDLEMRLGEGTGALLALPGGPGRRAGAARRGDVRRRGRHGQGGLDGSAGRCRPRPRRACHETRTRCTASAAITPMSNPNTMRCRIPPMSTPPKSVSIAGSSWTRRVIDVARREQGRADGQQPHDADHGSPGG